MPAGVDHAVWARAKAAARKQYPWMKVGDRFWSIVMTIYKNMKGGK